MNATAFKGAVVSAGYTLKKLAAELGMSNGTMTRKIKRGTFTIREAQQIVEILHLDNPAFIFFGKQ